MFATKKTQAFAGVLAMTVMALGLLAGGSASAQAEYICPAAANDGSNPSVQVILENRECSAKTVRIISSIVGNAGNTLAGLGVYGPAVAEPLLIVPPGTSTFCGCNTGTCDCSGGSCSDDSDCPFCSASTPGVLNTVITAEPELPTELTGSVATLIFMTETENAQGSVDTGINECFVEVL